LPTPRGRLIDGFVENADTLASRKRHSRSSIMDREAMSCMVGALIFEDEVKAGN
jgi:hypothetical protein